MKRNKHCQYNLSFFYKSYNVSAVKMHKLAQHVGGCVRGANGKNNTRIKFKCGSKM